MKTYNKLIHKNTFYGTGWLPPVPDLRDYTENHDEIKPLNKKLGMSAVKVVQATSVDLCKWCSPVENQGDLGSCTANAATGIIEYYERRAFGKHIEASRLFLYKVTRNLMQTTGDAGAWIRCTMGALKLCGVPAEKYWPYKVEKFDAEPTAFVYSIADNFEAVKYFRHDAVAGRKAQSSGESRESEGLRAQVEGNDRRRSVSGSEQGIAGTKNAFAKVSTVEIVSGGKRQSKSLSANRTSVLSPVPCAPDSKDNVLLSVKSYLEAGIPSMFGFWGFQSYDKSDTKGGIPYPAEGESAQWGHAVAAVGYDDNKKIKNTVDGKETTGALLIRNSWGKEWGENGYGWLPYDYVLDGLAEDFWSIISMEWVETGQFGV